MRRDISRGVLRFPLSLVFMLAAVLAGCGSSPPSAESVARAWSQELNSGDNEAAAKLFAPGAEIVQAGTTLRLNTQAEAVAWNAALPCSGRIVSIETHNETATATFELGDRQQSKCDGPGQQVTAIFRVHKGKIVLWHQTTSEEAGPTI
jgi:limonene-1,2-epoxide hydrolase